MQANFDTDVFIVGGGPAGLAAALACREQGLEVMVADCAIPPIDKACGEGLMPDSLAVLAKLGISLEGCETGKFRGIRFLGEHDSVEAGFPSGHGVGIRRPLLHEALVQRAKERGVQTLWGARVTNISADTVVVNGGSIRARWIIGADGHNSQVRRWAGLSAGPARLTRVGLRRHFQMRPWSEFVEIYWGSRGQAYVTPVAENEICVALISRQRYLSFEHGLAEFPQLAARLSAVAPSTRARGALSLSRKLPVVYRGNIALIGEASGAVDAITGEGLAMAFRQALALGLALASGALSAYATAHRKMMRLPSLMSATMLLMDNNGGLCSRSLRALSRQPELFARLLALHVGELGLKDFGASSLFHLGWRLLLA
jgi:flavin-dependent dehydrogenase